MTTSIKEFNVAILNQTGKLGENIIHELSTTNGKYQEPPEDTICIGNLSHRNTKAKILQFNSKLVEQRSYRFFLINQTVSIIILETRTTGDQKEIIDFWVQEIRQFSKCAIAFLIFHKDEIGYQEKINSSSLNSGEEVTFHYISTADSKDLAPFRQFLLDKLSRNFNSDMASEKWIEIKNKINNDANDYITEKDFYKICASKGVLDKKERESLLVWLNKCGAVITIFDDILQQDLLIVNPNWIAKAINSIHNSNAIFTNHSVLEMSMIVNFQVLPEYRHKDEKLQIIHAMEKFGLCLRIESDAENPRYLIPTLIDKEDKFVGDWSDPNVKVVYEYNISPIHLMPHLIAKLYPYIKSYTHWQNGCLIYYGVQDPAKALIMIGAEKNCIQVLISGNSSKACAGLEMLIQETITKLSAKIGPGIPNQTIHQKSIVSRKKSIALSSLRFVFLKTPYAIGRFILDIFGRDKATDLTATMLGYILIVISIAIGFGSVKMDTLVSWFIYNWRFFFPSKP